MVIFPVRNANNTKFDRELHKAIFSAFYKNLQPNLIIFLLKKFLQNLSAGVWGVRCKKEYIPTLNSHHACSNSHIPTQNIHKYSYSYTNNIHLHTTSKPSINQYSIFIFHYDCRFEMLCFVLWEICIFVAILYFWLLV
jgi:hypothetical protein